MKPLGQFQAKLAWIILGVYIQICVVLMKLSMVPTIHRSYLHVLPEIGLYYMKGKDFEQILDI